MSEKNTIQVIKEIQQFLEGRNDKIVTSDGVEHDMRYLVNIEGNPDSNKMACIFHRPNKKPELEYIEYRPFIYIKDLKALNINLYGGNEDLFNINKIRNGIEIIKLRTGNHRRLKEGFSYMVTSTISLNAIYKFFADGGLNLNEKINNGSYSLKYKDIFFSLKPEEQFLIHHSVRLFKGIDNYSDLHRMTIDIETTTLRYKTGRIIQIGIRDNRGFEAILEVKKINDDEEEAKLIIDFFNTIQLLKPAVIVGHNIEGFDMEYIIGRANELGLNLDKLHTCYKADKKIYRRENASVKIGNSGERYTATVAWGYTIIDTLHAVKRTAAVNSEIKSTKLKYIAKFEKIAKPDRMYINGSDGTIGKMWIENKVYIINPKNNVYEVIPDQWQQLSAKLYLLQLKKKNISEDDYKRLRNEILIPEKEFVSWLRNKKETIGDYIFTTGKKIVRRYLLDDLWETEQIDNLYNQSSFLLAKIVPTTYQRTATMGNASVWNILMTAWSYENGLAIPEHDKSEEKFSGGLVRCYKRGYSKNVVKLDFGSLYPMIQLSEDVFPIFDITNVIKKMLTYMTTTRNIYKKLAKNKTLNEEEIELLQTIDNKVYNKLKFGEKFTDEEMNLFDVKQLPIKIINNSLFGALGSGVAFNWSDSVCAARITCTGRLYLRRMISWFKKYGCIPLLAVTDGVNFSFDDLTTIDINGNPIPEPKPIDEVWIYGGNKGIAALIHKFNTEELKSPFMSIDNDGKYESCLNISRINYALMYTEIDKKTGEVVMIPDSNNGNVLIPKKKIKLTGNTIKSKVMPEYIEEFVDKGLRLILEGKGAEFIEYYYDYLTDIYYKRIPLKKIATKKKYKETIKEYLNRGTDKNGRLKAKKAHMELIIAERNKMHNQKFREIYLEKYRTEPPYDDISKITFNDNDLIEVRRFIENKMEENEVILFNEKINNNENFRALYVLELSREYLQPEPELDSIIYLVNIGKLQSHGDSCIITDKKTGETYMASRLISSKVLEENPEMTGEYNVARYISAFNKRVKTLLEGFSEEVKNNLIVKSPDKRNYFTKEQSELRNYDHDDFDESMYLEKSEIKFWNKTGYNPFKIWDGFKIPEDQVLVLPFYDNAIKYVSELLSKKMNKHVPVKSVNDKLNKGDAVLIKNYESYSLGKFNGEYIEIVMEEFNVPLTDIELKMREERIREEVLIKKANNKDKINKSISFEGDLESEDIEYDDYVEDFS